MTRTPKLIVTIDTEEEGLWSGQYQRVNNTVENVHGIDRFQDLCDRFEIRPTYLIDGPIVQSDWAVELLATIQDEGRAEIGAHLHPWCNPPLVEEINPRNSYLCNLPEDLQRDKIGWLTDEIEGRIGRRPTSFRAGRYGLDATGQRILASLGYTVDSSVIPFSDFRADGGPDYRRANCEANFVGGLLEVPVTVGFNRLNFRRADLIRRIASKSPWRQLKCVGILDRLGIVKRIKLSPEQADLRRMKRLVQIRTTQAALCVVLMFHSSSLVPGYSPYVRNQAALDIFYQRLAGIFQFCKSELNMGCATLTEFARQLTEPQSCPTETSLQEPVH